MWWIISSTWKCQWLRRYGCAGCLGTNDNTEVPLSYQIQQPSWEENPKDSGTGGNTRISSVQCNKGIIAVRKDTFTVLLQCFLLLPYFSFWNGKVTCVWDFWFFVYLVGLFFVCLFWCCVCLFKHLLETTSKSQIHCSSSTDFLSEEYYFLQCKTSEMKKCDVQVYWGFAPPKEPCHA